MLRACNRLVWLLWVPLFAVAAEEGVRERAFDLYDAGRFDEARVLLEELAAGDAADGITVYRLFYCRQQAGDPETRRTLERARELLEQASGESRDLETHFYLANAYTNLDRPDDSRRAAAEATARFEQGELPEPGTPIDMFRLGKLYADQQREIEAVRWYGRAADGFEASGRRGHRTYLRWAARYLADRAFEAERYEEAAKQLGRLLEDEEGTFEDWERLALSTSWIGRYEEAGKAWRRAARLAPGRSDRAHYGASVADRAAASASVAGLAPDGRAWEELDQSELEQVLIAEAARVREAVRWARGAGHRLHFVEQLALQQRIGQARPFFVAAAMEFLLRGYPLREKAFSQGYAALILREQEWSLDQPAPSSSRRRRGRP